MVTAPFGASQKIVIVEDNQALSDIYKTRLEMLGYVVFAAFDGVQALAVIERERPDLVLLDLMIPKIAGDQVLERMRSSDWGRGTKVVIISNLNEVDAPAGLRNLGIDGYAVKANLSNDQLDQLVDAILKPAGQTENVVLAHPNPTQVAHAEPSAPPDMRTADPYSGTSLQSAPAIETAPVPTPPAVPVAPAPAPAVKTATVTSPPPVTAPNPTAPRTLETLPVEGINMDLAAPLPATPAPAATPQAPSAPEPAKEPLSPDDQAL